MRVEAVHKGMGVTDVSNTNDNKVKLNELADRCASYNVPLKYKGSELALYYKYDTWLISVQDGFWSVRREDKFTGDILKYRIKEDKKPKEVLNFIYQTSIGRSLDPDDCIANLVRRTAIACEKRGLEMTYRYGEIHIDSKFEKWYFIPRMGKLKLMHLSSRLNKRGEYHEQFNKMITVEGLVNYIYRHTNSKYIPKRGRHGLSGGY